MKPKVCILRSDGTNCDEDLAYAFEKTGAIPSFVHVNELRTKSKKLADFQILALPGGFSYGDDLASGKVLAVELMSFFRDDLKKFVDKNGFVIGICNGFQTLIRTGLLPFRTLGEMSATLTHNDSGHFECRWTHMKTEPSKAAYFNDLSIPLFVSINHGEGKFYAKKDILDKIEKDNLVVFRYTDERGNVTMDYPDNPNGAINSIAGITDMTGRILGLMPHPEKYMDQTQHPNWRKEKIARPHGELFFERIVEYVKQS